MFKFIPECERTHPDLIIQHRAKIEKFQRKIAEDIVQKLLVLISILLELPEDYLSKGHRYDDVSECHLRYMQYRARSAQENELYQNIYTNGHTDFGSMTLLFRQPIAALQIKTNDGSWKWVKPYPESKLRCCLSASMSYSLFEGFLTLQSRYHCKHCRCPAILDQRIFEVIDPSGRRSSS
jgi:isopenicillin N synthase-like dioxygenase